MIFLIHFERNMWLNAEKKSQLYSIQTKIILDPCTMSNALAVLLYHLRKFLLLTIFAVIGWRRLVLLALFGLVVWPRLQSAPSVRCLRGGSSSRGSDQCCCGRDEENRAWLNGWGGAPVAQQEWAETHLFYLVAVRVCLALAVEHFVFGWATTTCHLGWKKGDKLINVSSSTFNSTMDMPWGMNRFTNDSLYRNL